MTSWYITYVWIIVIGMTSNNKWGHIHCSTQPFWDRQPYQCLDTKAISSSGAGAMKRLRLSSQSIQPAEMGVPYEYVYPLVMTNIAIEHGHL